MGKLIPWVYFLGSFFYSKVCELFERHFYEKKAHQYRHRHSLFEEGSDVLDFMAKHTDCWVKDLLDLSSEAVSNFGPFWNSKLFNFWLCLLHLPFLPLVLAWLIERNQSIPLFQWKEDGFWPNAKVFHCLWMDEHKVAENNSQQIHRTQA